MSIKHIVFCAALSVFLAGSAFAQSLAEMSLPRFASFRFGMINARSGPGKRYPIDWVYKQKNAPVEVIQAYEYRKEMWYKIRDWDNSESWVLHAKLSKKRTAKVMGEAENNVYAKGSYDAKIIAKAEKGAVADIVKCPRSNEFCLLKFKSQEGWMPRKDLFGVYPDEVIK